MPGEMNGSDSRDAVVAEARSLGWAPKEEWRGDPERWIDADVFVQRGHEMMPLLKATNKRLSGQVDAQAGEIAELRRLHQETLGTLEDLKKFSAEHTAAKVKEAKASVMAQLKKAKEDGNADLEVELTDQLVDLRAQERTAAAPAPAPAPADDKPKMDPLFEAWMNEPENSWFIEDEVKQAAAVAMARQLRKDPANKAIVGKAFYDLVGEKTLEKFGPAGGVQQRSTKVEGSRGGSGGSGGGGPRAKTYNDLPADAKAACDKQGQNFIGKAGYKTEADWRSYYCTMYFAGDDE